MKFGSFVFVLVLVISLAAWAQDAPSSQQSSTRAQAGSGQRAASNVAAGQGAQHRERMQAMCREHIEAMKNDVQKMHSAFDKMKGNIAGIGNADEKALWQANLDMWQIVIDQHDQMLKHMQEAQAKGVGCGMMMGEMGMDDSMKHHHGMAPTDAPAMSRDDTKPQ